MSDVTAVAEKKEPLLKVENLKKHFLINKAFKKENRKYLRAVDGARRRQDDRHSR